MLTKEENREIRDYLFRRGRLQFKIVREFRAAGNPIRIERIINDHNVIHNYSVYYLGQWVDICFHCTLIKKGGASW